MKQLKLPYSIILYSFLLLALLLAAFFPIHFMADDFEHLFYYAIGVPDGETTFFLYRIPLLYVTHALFFPLFAQGHFFLVKFVLWGCHLASGWIFLHFIHSQVKNYRELALLVLLTFFALFFPNNHEWNLWPVSMTNLVFNPLIALIFYWDYKWTSQLTFLLKVIVGAGCFFLFESYFFLVCLIELAGLVYFKFNFKRSLTYALTWGIIIAGLKIYFSQYNTYKYTAELGFHYHLFEQWASLFFNLDFYKTRWILGAPFLLGLLFLAKLRIGSLGVKKFVTSDFIILAGIFIASSYYFTLMGYSARRTLHGQLWFWGMFVASGLWWVYVQDKITRVNKIAVYALILIPAMIHQGSIAYEKKVEMNRHQLIAQSWVKQIEEGKEKITVNLGMLQQGMRRGFGFTIPKQVLGFVWYYLPPSLHGCVEIQDLTEDRHPLELKKYQDSLSCPY